MIERTRIYRDVRVWAALSVLVLCSCKGSMRGFGSAEPVDPESMTLLLPTKIKVHSFTKIKPLFGSPLPNGIEVWLEPRDRFGDVVKIVGDLRFELYRYKPASSDPKGEQIEFWEAQIATAKDQQQYWDKVARMYQFPLGWDYAPPAGKRYILLATYQPPAGERITDQYELRFEFDKKGLIEALQKPESKQEE